MKKCLRCGKMVEDNVDVCDNCAFNFVEYEYKKKHGMVVIKEDPELTKQERTARIDSPILTFICGIIAILMGLMIIPTRSILFMILGLVFSVLTMFLAVKPSLVKLMPLQNVGKWLGYIAFAITVFSTVYVISGVLLG